MSATSYLIGLIGAGIGGSLSPAMHEQEGHWLGLSYVYRRIDLDVLQLDVSELPQLLKTVEGLGFNGLNITYPCKQAIIPLLDDLSDDARALGAVNTVVLRDGRRIGHNTDWSGFARSFQRGLGDASLQRVVLLGAGGAGRAVGHALLKLGARELSIFDVDASRAVALAAELGTRFDKAQISAGGELGEALANASGLVHATPTGMAKLPGLPLPASLLHAGLWVADIVYFPIETELIRAARSIGCRTLHGGGMAVYQAVEAFNIFTDIQPDANRMNDHFQTLLSR